MSNELPRGWEAVLLKDLLVPRSERVSPQSMPNAPFIGMEHVEPHTNKVLATVPASTVGSNAARFYEGDVLYGRMRPYLNKVAAPTFDGLASAEFIVFPKSEVIDSHFLLRRLSSNDFTQFACSQYEGDRPRVKFDQLGNFEVLLPPAAEQFRIVEKLEELLSDLDAGVAELKAAQRKLTQYRKSLLKAAVEGALTADWRATNGEPQETGAELLQRILAARRARWEQKQLAKFVKQGKTPPKGWQAKYPESVTPDLTDLPPLPDTWVWASLDMLGEIASGVAKGAKRAANSPTREVPYLRVANVQRGYLDLTQIKTIEATESDIAELRLEPGDVLFNEGGDLDKLGRGWVWYGEISECIHQNHVFRMRPILSATPSEFISHQGNTFGKEWFKNAGKQTTNLASINMTMLRAFPVPVPPESESAKVIALLEPLLAATAEQEKSIERGLVLAATQRKNVLAAAFSGQIVPQDPNDEPASVLLDRIRVDRATRAKQPKTRKVTKKQEIAAMVRKLVDVLTAATDWLPAQEVFRRCGITDGALTDQVEELYVQLRELDKAGTLQVEAVTDANGIKLHDRLKLRTL